MGSGRPSAQPQDVPARVYLITPWITDPAALIDALVAALEAADVAAVLARFAGADDAGLDAGSDDALIERVEALCPVVQQRGVALLIDGRPDIAARAGADGAHVAGLRPLEAALTALRPERMVGIGGLTSRHDAMVAAEAGADYLMFGEPDAAGRRSEFDAVVERVEWWAELFQVPCVGFAENFGEVARLATAGADFVAVGDLIWSDHNGAGGAMRAVAERLRVREPAQ
jgi:thiamine-phosphate pyrophosphorylase